MDDSSTEILGLEEDDETAGQIFKRLTTAWVNEKCCPDLLKNQNDLVDCMMDQIKQMEENLKGLSHEDFLVVPHRMEIDRIRYVISSYLRTRLEKIESYTFFLLKRDRSIPNEDDRYMSRAEFQFAEQYLESIKSHFHEEASKHTSTLLNSFHGIDVEVRPDMRSIVTLKVLRSVEGVLINGTPVNLEVDAYHMLPFNDVRNLIDSGIAVCV
ncbi:hypothetical protein RUM43_003384 [Polyplax serrata]|uniref:DNA replication complex GINS protein SLD5 n=1 Tax=Polyplax serrata TaxID=468196 RepID=A0AAN8PFF6_POLSC